jgi:hypothetical protein
LAKTHLDAELDERRSRLLRQGRVERRKQPWPGLDQSHSGRARIDRAEVRRLHYWHRLAGRWRLDGPLTIREPEEAHMTDIVGSTDLSANQVVDSGLVQGLINAGLIGAERPAALQHEDDLADIARRATRLKT